MATETIEVEGHIIDSLILAKIMDVILAAGADYRVVEVDIGKTNTDTSRARIEVEGDSEILSSLRTNSSTRATVSSDDPSSTTMSSKSDRVCLRADMIAASTVAAEL